MTQKASTGSQTMARDVGPYQLFMLSLCLWALLVLGAGVVFRIDGSTATVLDYADNVVCAFFFVDFLYTLGRAPRKLHYLATWGWIDLLSSIPTVDVLRWGRAARLMRILRVLRAVKSTQQIAHFIAERRAESAFLASLFICLLLLVFSSIAILQFEAPAGGNIQSAQDAMWWAMSTMTTVGYGDTYPTSPEGRFVAVFLMAAGVGVFGTMSGLAASWFLSPAAQEAQDDRSEIKALLEQLRDRLERDIPPDGGLR